MQTVDIAPFIKGFLLVFIGAIIGILISKRNAAEESYPEKLIEEYKRQNDTLRAQRDELFKMVDYLYGCCEKLKGQATEEGK